MSTLKISHPLALELLMSEDIYMLKADETSSAAIESAPAPATSELVEAPVLPVIEKPEPAYFEYLGENNKYILILVNQPNHQFLEPKELETLTNILKGKKQELKDVAVVNLYKYPGASFKGLKEFFACSSIVFFGINPSVLQIKGIQANQISAYQETKILVTYSIGEMLANTDKKRAFWEEMKKL